MEAPLRIRICNDPAHNHWQANEGCDGEWYYGMNDERAKYLSETHKRDRLAHARATEIVANARPISISLRPADRARHPIGVTWYHLVVESLGERYVLEGTTSEGADIFITAPEKGHIYPEFAARHHQAPTPGKLTDTAKAELYFHVKWN